MDEPRRAGALLGSLEECLHRDAEKFRDSESIVDSGPSFTVDDAREHGAGDAEFFRQGSLRDTPFPERFFKRMFLPSHLLPLW